MPFTMDSVKASPYVAVSVSATCNKAFPYVDISSAVGLSPWSITSINLTLRPTFLSSIRTYLSLPQYFNSILL